VPDPGGGGSSPRNCTCDIRKPWIRNMHGRWIVLRRDLRLRQHSDARRMRKGSFRLNNEWSQRGSVLNSLHMHRRQACTSDPECQAYVVSKEHTECNHWTTSKCNKGGEKFNEGSVGLSIDGVAANQQYLTYVLVQEPPSFHCVELTCFLIASWLRCMKKKGFRPKSKKHHRGL